MLIQLWRDLHIFPLLEPLVFFGQTGVHFFADGFHLRLSLHVEFAPLRNSLKSFSYSSAPAPWLLWPAKSTIFLARPACTPLTITGTKRSKTSPNTPTPRAVPVVIEL